LLPCAGVGVTGVATPDVGVGGGHHDAVGIGPVVVQAFPDAARSLGDVGPGGTLGVHLEVLVGAVAEHLRAAGSEVDERGEELLGRGGGGPGGVDRGHVVLLGCGASLLIRVFAFQALLPPGGGPGQAAGNPRGGGARPGADAVKSKSRPTPLNWWPRERRRSGVHVLSRGSGRAWCAVRRPRRWPRTRLSPAPGARLRRAVRR